jgi:hypothetical protein
MFGSYSGFVTVTEQKIYRVELGAFRIEYPINLGEENYVIISSYLIDLIVIISTMSVEMGCVLKSPVTTRPGTKMIRVIIYCRL